MAGSAPSHQSPQDNPSSITATLIRTKCQVSFILYYFQILNIFLFLTFLSFSGHRPPVSPKPPKRTTRLLLRKFICSDPKPRVGQPSRLRVAHANLPWPQALSVLPNIFQTGAEPPALAPSTEPESAHAAVSPEGPESAPAPGG